MESAATHITSIRRLLIENLFGYWSYDLLFPVGEMSVDSRVAIIYGDNGSGKTTLLKLLFCLLSFVSGRGEKTFVAQTPFRKLEIHFDDGTVVSANKETDTLLGNYTITIQRSLEHVNTMLVRTEDGKVKRNPENDQILTELKNLQIHLFFLSDDRNIRTTIREEVETKPLSILFDEDDDESQLRLISLERHFRARAESEVQSGDINIVVQRVNAWIRNKVLQGASTGEINANSIYLDLIERISSAVYRDNSHAPPIVQIEERLGKIAKRNSEFSTYGLTAPFSAERILQLTGNAQPERGFTLATILEPYLNALEARLNALTPIHAVVSTFVSVIGEFFAPKRLEFTVNDGLKVFDVRGRLLSPRLLSSGERQLLLIMCSTLLARDQATLFFIDEPELSLNIKWQRMLIDALVACSADSNIQYILASHSLEILAKHRNRILHLRSTNG